MRLQTINKKEREYMKKKTSNLYFLISKSGNIIRCCTDLDDIKKYREKLKSQGFETKIYFSNCEEVS
jgi:hypothetical protein